MTAPAAVVAEGLRKRYGRTVALDGLSFEFPAGRLTGFLGPNGAGKTTTLRVLLGLTRLDAGVATIGGLPLASDLPQIVKQVGAIVDEPGLLRPLTGRHNLVVAAHTLGFGHDRVDELADFVELTGDLDRPVTGYSKGMRQRLALAAALLGNPEILFLDEPLDGLDPAGQHAFKQRLRELVDRDGKTVVVSSHDMADVEALADHVVIIHRGALRYQGALIDLLGDGRMLRVRITEPDSARSVLEASGLTVEQSGEELLVATDNGSAVSRTLAGAGLYPNALIPAGDTLEAVFLEMTTQ